MNSDDSIAEALPFHRYDSEKYFLDVRYFHADEENNDGTEKNNFLDDSTSKFLKFPSILDEPSVYLSIIIPARDEEKRLSPMLDECLDYLERKCRNDSNFTYEIIVVDDSSSDQTSHLALTYAKRVGNEKFRVLTLERNRGKGGAVRFGFWSARGRRLLFADADGATKFHDLDKLLRQMDVLTASTTEKGENFHGNNIDDAAEGEKTAELLETEAVVVGSRAHLEKESIVERSLFRTVLMFGFHFLVWLFCVKTVRDTQCGFKLFTRSAARVLFWNLHVERWAFDVELLYLAEKLRIPLAEVPVTWHEVAGSKLTPLAASIEMARDLFMIWLRYFLGVWTIRSPPTPKKRS